MIVHLCCSVDAGYFLKRLKEEYPNEKIIGYFYNPNIHPYSEFKLRALDTKKICQKENIEFIEGEYAYEIWYKKTKGLQNEPEKGKRCSICFDLSLEKTALLAKKLNHNKITTSLLMSPMKSHTQIEKTAKVLKRKHNIDFIIVDFRKKGGTQAQQHYAKENSLYRQNYCGCIYGMINSPNQEELHELYSPYPFQILPNSIEEKIDFFKNLKGKYYKENFLNYRLLQSLVLVENQPIWHYTIFYSHTNKKEIRCKIEKNINEIYLTNRGNIFFIPLEKLNSLLNKNYKTIKDLYKTPLTIQEEITLRNLITKTPYNLSILIVVEEIAKKYKIFIKSKIFLDEKLCYNQ